MTPILFPHTALHVQDLEVSIDFYKILFSAEPLKVREGYAKFELHNPRWNFTLNQIPPTAMPAIQAVSHLGFQVDTSEAVLELKSRLEAAGLLTIEEMNVSCCYSVQDKFWVKDPNGIDWEIFTVLSDVDVYGDSSPARHAAMSNAACCTPSAQVVSIALPVIDEKS
jgi:catechol 2,3-dioxygenase-like lactoylglutathione lyase family enzyme